MNYLTGKICGGRRLQKCGWRDGQTSSDGYEEGFITGAEGADKMKARRLKVISYKVWVLVSSTEVSLGSFLRRGMGHGRPLFRLES